MKKVLAVVLGLATLFLAGYVGIVVLFVGGIVQIVDAVQASPVDGADIAWGALRVLLASAGAGLIITAGFAGVFGLWDSAEATAARKRTAARRTRVQAQRRALRRDI